MRKLSLAAIAAVVLAAGAASAQPAPPQPSAHALELSHRLVMAVHITDTVNGMLQTLTPQMIDMQSKRIPNFKPEWRQPLIDSINESMAAMMPSLMQKAEVAYAQVFTEEELAQAAAFYESPVGQSMIRKSPQVMPLVMKDFSSMVVGAQADTTARFCRKIGGCGKPGGPEMPKPS